MYKSTLRLRSILGIAGITIAMQAGAGPIVNGREWYQPNDVTNYSWSDFDAICPLGLCSGQIGGSGPDLTGWVWASIYDVGDLFQATTPHPGGIASYTDSTPLQDPLWAYNFLALFDRTYYEPGSPDGGGMGVFGLTSTLDATTGTPYWGVVGAYISGWIRPGIPEVDGAVRTGLSTIAAPDERIGAWLYRYDPATVPAPATILLLAIGLAVLAWTKRVIA